MRCKIKVFCVLAAVSSSWLHERHGAERCGQLTEEGNLTKLASLRVAPWRSGRPPVVEKGDLTKSCRPAGRASGAGQLGPFPKTFAPRRAAAGSARVRGCNSPAPLTRYLGCGSVALLVRKFALHVPQHCLAQGQMVFQRRCVMQSGGGRADHRAAFGVIEGTPHRSLYLPRRPAGKRINLQAAAFAPPVAPCFCRAVVSRELLDLQP